MINRNLIIIILIALMALFPKSGSGSPTERQKILSPLLDSSIKAMAVHPTQSSTIFLGTTRHLYRSSDSGQSFQPVVSWGSSYQGINSIFISEADPPEIYVATDSSVFLSKDNGKTWGNIFHTFARDRICRAILTDKEMIYLGTSAGLLVKERNEPIWHKENSRLNEAGILFIAKDTKYIYFSLTDEIIRFDKARKEYLRVFSAGVGGVGKSGEDFAIREEEKEEAPIKAMAAVNDRVFVATIQGVFASGDQGNTWQKLEEEGVPVKEVVSLGAPTQEILYAATNRGIFFVKMKQAVSQENGGGFRSEKAGGPEPTILQVQKMAIEYAEVNPQKIQNWRRAARKKAWLPNVSVGIDRSATDLFHWDSGPNPDNLLKGRDFLDWDVSLSWDLGDLIWNPDQTSIDSRSKLMVELRQDILDQVTRLYFERRRLQAELRAFPALDPQLRFDKEMRIAELTALIDGFTGGGFSKGTVNTAQLNDNQKNERGGIQ